LLICRSKLFGMKLQPGHLNRKRVFFR